MAAAFCRVFSVLGDGAAQKQILTLEVGYIGSPETMGGGADLQLVPVELLPDDSANNIKVKMTQAVLADAMARGYTLAAKDTTLPVFQKATP